jgi:hypothetical protein
MHFGLTTRGMTLQRNEQCERALPLTIILVYHQHEHQQNLILVPGTKCQGETRS